MINPSFIIQNFATCYYYFPKWTCLYLERKFINTSEKAQKFREEAKRNTKGLRITDEDRPRDILQKIMEKNKLPTDSKMLRLMIKQNSLTFKRRSRTASKTNSRHGKKKTRSRSVKKKKGFLNTIKSYIFGNPQDNAINKQKYIERSLVVIFILGFLGVSIHNIQLEEKVKSVQKNNCKLKTDNLDLENNNKKYKKRVDFTYGLAAFKQVENSLGITVWVQEQYEGNCMIHSVNNLLAFRDVNGNVFKNPISLIDWATSIGTKHTNKDYMDGGYNPLELENFLKDRNITFKYYGSKGLNSLKEKQEFINKYNSTNYGILFGVSGKTGGHALCIKKNLTGLVSSTYVDSNFPNYVIGLRNAADVHDFLFITEGWKKDYLKNYSIHRIHFVGI